MLQLKLITVSTVLLLAGCRNRNVVNVLGKSLQFCDRMYGAPETVIDTDSGSTRIYDVGTMLVSVSMRDDAVSAVAYLNARSYSDAKKGIVSPLQPKEQARILAAYAPPDQWDPFGKESQSDSLLVTLVTKDRRLMASIQQAGGIVIGDLSEMRQRLRQRYPSSSSGESIARMLQIVTNAVGRMTPEDKERYSDLAGKGDKSPDEEAESKMILQRYFTPGEWDEAKRIGGTLAADLLDGNTNWTQKLETAPTSR